METAITGQLLLYAKGVELAIAGRLADSLARKPHLSCSFTDGDKERKKTREKVANNVRELVSRSAIWGETVALFTFSRKGQRISPSRPQENTKFWSSYIYDYSGCLPGEEPVQKNSKWLMASWSPAHPSVLFAVDPTKVGGERKTRLVDEIVETRETAKIYSVYKSRIT